MTPTPRTDERANNWESTDGQWVSADFARELERELAAEREQVAILRSDERRLTQFAKDYRLRADEAEDQLTANHEATKLMGKWLEDERELADRLAGVLLSYNHDLLAGEDMQWLPEHDEALTAWKEARSGAV